MTIHSQVVRKQMVCPYCLREEAKDELHVALPDERGKRCLIVHSMLAHPDELEAIWRRRNAPSEPSPALLKALERARKG